MIPLPPLRKKISHNISETTEITGKTIPSLFTRTLAALWLWSGIQPLAFAPAASLALLAQIGIAAPWQWPLFVAASLLDIAFGLACLTPLRQRAAFWRIQAAVIVLYSLIIAWRLPEYLNHPFAPVLKNLPILAILLFLIQHTKKSP